MGRGPIALAAAIVVAALLLAGCGGGGDDSEGKPISKEEFIAKANAICKKGTERLQRKILDGLNGQLNLNEVSKAQQEKLATTVMAPSVAREAKELRALGIPEGDEERVEAMIGALEEGVEAAERNPEAVANSSDVVFGISSRIAGEYGLSACATR